MEASGLEAWLGSLREGVYDDGWAVQYEVSWAAPRLAAASSVDSVLGGEGLAGLVEPIISSPGGLGVLGPVV